MDICTFETAKKLKAAGFEHPEFSCWQVWYNGLGIGTFLGKKVLINGIMHFSCYSLGSGREKSMVLEYYDEAVFSPTATDILKYLEGFYLSSMIGGAWGVFKVGARGMMIGFHPDNPAEACAEAYLSLVS